MSKPKVFVTRKLSSQFVKEYEEILDIRMWDKEEEPVPEEILRSQAKEVDALFTVLGDRIDETLLAEAKNLKVVANMAVGYDNIDIDAASKHGITVANTPDVLSETTADLGFSLLAATARRITEASTYVKEDNWKQWGPFLLAGTDIHHKTLGIVGMGRIGEALAKRATGFNMKIQYHNRSRKPEAEEKLQASYVSFEELLETSDFVVTVVPFTKETEELFNESAFKKMKASAIFINISRGKVVDETALIDALNHGEIKAAGLDVFYEEPIRADHPLVNMDNVVCLPHIGSASTETRTEMIHLCMKNIVEVTAGRVATTPVNN
ncbi:glycerate dehydrogenase [Oceanobacillus iheyensis HTE831]|uniref:Glycerate dehydrogenase n=1 Tax=Oceanobacillus iheyensis (strain DSM 14371 / CIP 107618 / JCM 11309 / KCTC 3954 / HTE831) TaxID=221109 RepID=Q8ENW9_OCEIH|nr:D-glycerate dehydrogenase [Oceanobacillus iheyensis]BAC14313.1 glycerate dehydrogenase [Oceanobacillus iheyensis HTE831]